MNTTATPRGSPRDSLLRRLSFTPLSDLIRGRLTSRLDLESHLASSGLHEPIPALIRTVVKKTRLWDTEKADVAHELIAHFQDGLARGSTADELAASFGPIPLAATLIRRAKKRNRAFFKAYIFSLRGLCILFAVCLLAYGLLALRLWLGSVVVRRNYAAEYNAPILTIKAEDKAWPLYKKAYLAASALPEVLKGCSPNIRTAQWSEWARFAARNDEPIALYRSAASKPKLGRLLSDADDPEIARHERERSPWFGNAPINTKGSENPLLFEVRLTELQVLREGALLMQLDAYRAILSGRGDVLASDLEAMQSIAAHAHESPLIISHLVSITILGEFERLVGSILAEHAELLSDARWIRLSHRLAAGNPESARTPWVWEWAAFDDMIQRVYTDDGSGNGHLADVRFLTAITGGPRVGDQPRLQMMLSPVVSALVADRREIIRKFDELKALVEQEDAIPLWERTESRADRAVVRINESSLTRMRYLPAAALFPALSRASFLNEVAIQERDAVLVAISLELFHRRAGAYPASLTDLVPQFLPAVPYDRYDGGPIKYRLVNGKPLLFSVGANRRDDGGRLPPAPNPMKANRLAREWIAPSDLAKCRAEGRADGIPDGDWILWPPVEEARF